MARKAKQLAQNKITTPRDDDDIPEKILDLVTKQSIKTRSIYPGGLAKSWEISPIYCNKIESFSSSPQLRYSTKDLEAYKGPLYGPTTSHYYPNWENNTPLKHMAFSNDPNNIVAVGVTGVFRPLFMFYKQKCPWFTKFRVRRRYSTFRHDPNAHKWVNYDYAIIDPNSSTQKYMQLVNIVGLNGKFYALSLQGTLVVIEEIDTCMVITCISSSRAVPSVPSRHFREYLVESDGELWVIFLISTKSASVTDNVEIFRLQLENLAWKKVERLAKDRAVFVGAKSCLVVTASEVKCKGNCVFFTNRVFDGWWVYDVAKGDISQCSSSSDSSAIFG